MAKRSIIPFGPQHPVLPEPVHLDLVLEDETVVGVIPSIGYIHRGLEKLVDKRDFKQYTYVAERICGICSCGHGLGYCLAVEQVMNIEVPDRAKYLRTIWVEMSRVHSHLLWLGLLADAMGFESLHMESWRLRRRFWICSMKPQAAVLFILSIRWAVCRGIWTAQCLMIFFTLLMI